MVYRVVVSPRAKRDLRGIQRYISFDNPQAALRFAKRLFTQPKVLSTHPEIGRVVPEFSDRTIREVVVGNYRVVHKVNHLKKQIRILRYWHGARGIPDLCE